MTRITRQTKGFWRYLRHTRAVSALEYAILVGVIATGIAAALIGLGDNIDDALEAMGEQVTATQNQALEDAPE